MFVARACGTTSSSSHLSQAGRGLFDGDLALVVDAGPDADALSGHEAAPVQLHTTDDRTRAQTAHAELVLHLTVKRLLRTAAPVPVPNTCGISGMQLMARCIDGRTRKIRTHAKQSLLHRPLPSDSVMPGYQENIYSEV